MKEKIFLCGAVTGYQNNKDVYSSLTAKLEVNGFEGVHPYQVFPNLPEDAVSENHFLRKCTQAMADCTRVITIKGWDDQSAARTLVDIARKLNMDVESEITFFS
ncbi:MAG TPA: DUF4406 domain-containing protein [Bacteroidia bacterium]|nr:DUF4406 domain-containing protein [Bacteroidia bacterium]